jgi:hypothetical protein
MNTLFPEPHSIALPADLQSAEHPASVIPSSIPCITIRNGFRLRVGQESILHKLAA